MTWVFDAGYPLPGDYVRLGQGQFRNIFHLGETLTFPLVGTAAVSTWEVIDHTGLTVATGGPIAASAGTWTAPVLAAGWYRVLFRRAAPVAGWGVSQGGGMFVVTRSIAGMPPRPPINLPTVGTFIDAGINWAALNGPLRLDGTVTDAEAHRADIEAGIAQHGTYCAPYDTSRPKPLLLSYPDGTDTADPATATANIGTMVTRYTGITHWEGQNEPGGHPAAWFVPAQQRFHQNVKNARPSAQVCGPSPVTIGGTALANLRAFLEAGGGQWIDTWTFHTYNAHMGDLRTGRRSWETWRALLTEFGQWGKPRLNSEAASFFGAEYGAGQLLRQAHRTLLDLFLHEQYGVPKERWAIFYTNSHGFWDYPSFILTDGQLPFPTVALLLTHSQELLGTAFETQLDFGTSDNDTLIGSIHRRADATGVAAVLSAGRSAASVTLQVAGGSPASLDVIDGFGRTSIATVTGGLTTITVGTAPTYVRLPAGVTAVPVDSAVRLGVLRSNGASATATGGSYKLGTTAQVLSGPWRNALYYDRGNNGDGASVWESNLRPTAQDPVDFTVTFPSPVPVDTVLIHCPPAWQASLSVIRDADVQVLTDGTWNTVSTIGYQPRTEEWVSSHYEGTNGWYESWDQDVHVFEVTFGRVTASGVRLRVRGVSAGGSPTGADLQAHGTLTSTGGAITAGMGNPDARLALQRVAVYDSQATNAGTGKYVVAAGALA